MNYNERKFNMNIAAVAGLREAVLDDDKFDHTYYYTFSAYGEELLDDGVCIDADDE